MIKPLSQRFALKWVCLFLMLMASITITFAQQKTGTKPAIAPAKPANATAKAAKSKPHKKKKVTPAVAANTAAIVAGKNTFVDNDLLADKYEPAGDYKYALIQIPLIITGKPPTSPFPVKFDIENKTAANAQFSSAAGFTSSITVNIDPSMFASTGVSTNISLPPITIRFNAKANTGGDAYITIDGQPAVYYDAIFYPPSILKNESTDGMPRVTMADNEITVQLDSFKSNTPQLVTATLGLTLYKGSMVRDTVQPFLVAAVSKTQAVQVLGNKDISPIPLASADWDAAANKTLNKTVEFYIVQKAMAKDTEYVHINLKNADSANTFYIKILPFKSKVKGALTLVAAGNADIVSLKRVGISHDYLSSLNSIDTMTVRVRLQGKYDSNHNQLFFSFLDSVNTYKHFKVLENPITITENEWNSVVNKPPVKSSITKKDTFRDSITHKITKIKTDTFTVATTEGVLTIPLHIQAVNISDTVNNIQSIDMILKGQTQVQRGTQRVKVSIKDVPFWAEGGTNFSLLDNIKSNNFYAGVYGFDKDVGRIGWFGKRNDSSQNNHNLSIIGGVYESQSTGSSATSSAGFVYRTYTMGYRDTGSISATTSVKSIGVLFSPMLKLTNGKTDADGFHMYASLYTELLWQTVNSTFNYANAKVAQQSTDTAKFSKAPYKETSLNYDFRSNYIGLGLPMYLKQNLFTLFINDVIGFTNQGYYITNKANLLDNTDPNGVNYVKQLTFSPPVTKWNPFLLVQYRLTDQAYGITFSGEIRQLLINNAKPEVTLALSKKFDLSKLFDSLFAAIK